MSKLTEALARLKIIPAADMSDDAAAAAVETTITGLNTQREALQTENTKHVNALQVRVTNRVQKAIDDKIVKAERKDSLIAIGIKNEADLDFLGDIPTATAAPAPVRRGAPPAPIVPEHKNAAEQLEALREEMKTEKDPKRIGELAIKCRELRGHSDLFSKPTKEQHVLIDGKAYPVVS